MEAKEKTCAFVDRQCVKENCMAWIDKECKRVEMVENQVQISKMLRYAIVIGLCGFVLWGIARVGILISS